MRILIHTHIYTVCIDIMHTHYTASPHVISPPPPPLLKVSIVSPYLSLFLCLERPFALIVPRNPPATPPLPLLQLLPSPHYIYTHMQFL